MLLFCRFSKNKLGAVYMMFKSKIATLISALILSGSGFALSQTPCPNINDIKAEGLTITEEMGANIYISYNISAYNTPSIWGFIMAPINSESDIEALDESNNILKEMTAPGVPDQIGSTTLCTYDTGRQDVYAGAIKDDSGQITPMKLKQYIRRAH
jgi:hypothetical protein